MRIITGRARGLKLLTPKDYAVRPTTDRVKESVFAIIGSRLVDAIVLDAFAGTGNLGLEAWSRGARKVVFVDQREESLRLVRRNISLAKAENETIVCRANVVRYLRILKAQGYEFDIIFADPPYNKGLGEQLIEELRKEQILRSGGLLVYEYSRHENCAIADPYGELIRTEKYGETQVSFILWK